MLFLTVHVATGAASLHETIHLLWTFNVPWHWAYPTAVEPWVAQFAFGLYGIMLTSLIVGILLTIIYRPRTWCVFCPMGNMTQMICKFKN
uniref:4Fe-4S binding protein n=1 Tax=Alloprevotella sp. TaxID=1872471 RepID=UPI0040269811